MRRDELDGPLALASTPLDRPRSTRLSTAASPPAHHRLEHYIAARDLAAAAAWVAGAAAAPAGPTRARCSRVEDVRRLHALATAGSPAPLPGAWRPARRQQQRRRLAAAVDRPVETAALLDRFRRRPADDLRAWLAAFLARFARIRPFAGANGRTARLAATLALRRLDAPPLVIPRAQAAAFRRALAGARQRGDAEPLRALVAAALAAVCNRLAAAGGDDALLPLRALAGDGYAALIKAAQRGRLRRSNATAASCSTAAWVAAYRAGARKLSVPGRRLRD